METAVPIMWIGSCCLLLMLNSICNPLSAEFLSLKVFLKLLIPCMFCTSTTAASIGNLSQGFFHHFCWGSLPWLQPLIGELSMAMALQPVNTLPTVPEMEPL